MYLLRSPCPAEACGYGKLAHLLRHWNGQQAELLRASARACARSVKRSGRLGGKEGQGRWSDACDGSGTDAKTCVSWSGSQLSADSSHTACNGTRRMYNQPSIDKYSSTDSVSSASLAELDEDPPTEGSFSQ